MAGEAVLQIGAVLDKDGVDTGMTDVAEVTKQTMAQITAVVEQAGAATHAGLSKFHAELADLEAKVKGAVDKH